MPLGDGKGPPDGTGPMTGRKRLASICPSSTPYQENNWALLGVGAAICLALVAWLVSGRKE
jgi:hypothetical protein